jgi:hypothetical protein
LGEGEGIAQRFELSEKLQGAIGVSLGQSLQHQVAEPAGEDFDRQEKFAGGGDPTLVVGRETAAGNYAVEMRMEVQILAPAMQDAEEAEFHAETFAGDGEQGLGGGMEKDAVDDFFVIEGGAAMVAGRVKTTWKYSVGSSSARRFCSQCSRAMP